ncbi:MAG: type II toxin-antitoxin system PemK/MazF family toxin [Ignavibacteriae bacterium]|nr:type II toxin-antitoxin system PemK/MazF family toxin [Ignavibacteriota bacterium]
MQRGEVWWANLPAPLGKRPVVLVSRQRAIQVRESVTVAQVTTVIREIPSEVFLDKRDGLPKSCVVNCDVLQTIPKGTLDNRITRLSTEKQHELDVALRFSLGLD